MLRFTNKPILLAAVCCLTLAVGALLLQAQTGVSDLWIRFPDGTIQTTAAHNCVNPADPDDEMIRVGGVCIDKYEASLWDAPTGGNQIPDAQIDTHCPDNGQPKGPANCEGFYARSVAGVQPAAGLTWFQAQQALANSGKRLPTSAEWQMAVSGTPDTADDGARSCNTDNLEPGVSLAGFRSFCVSRHGAFDMVGNVSEWVADWDEHAGACDTWPPAFGDDLTCIGRGEGDSENRFAAALLRGGDWNDGSSAGPFAVVGGIQPSGSGAFIGFRGAR